MPAEGLVSARLRAAQAAASSREGDRVPPVPGGARLGFDDARHRRHPGVRVGRVLPARLARGTSSPIRSGRRCSPMPHYGIMPLLSGTLTSSVVALVVAIPLGTIIAIYLSEFAPFTRARDRQAVPGAAGRRADHRLRLLRAAVRDAAAAADLSRSCPASTCSPPGSSWAS